MITIIGIKYFNLSFFHLIFHAYFKALLFLISGVIIHTIYDIQDLRKTGGLIKFLPYIYIINLIGALSLLGFPFTTGFFSKELILNHTYISISLLSHYTYIIIFLSALFTIFYNYRFLYMIYLSDIKLSIFGLKFLHYIKSHILISLLILSIITIFFGFYFFKFLHNFDYITFSFYSYDIPLFIKLLPLIFIIFIFIFILFISNSFYYYLQFFSYIKEQFAFKLLYIFISGYFFSLSYRIFFKLFDYGFLDLFTSYSGLYSLNFSKFLHKNIFNNYSIDLVLFFIFILLLI